MNQPNVILLTIDTLRADVLGCYGDPSAVTPNIDRLASNGLRFTQAITGGSWTQAAFPVILTSSYASMYGGCLGALAPERPSPIEALAQHGYTTAGFSSNPHLSRATYYDRGFDYFVDLAPADQDPPLRRIKGGQRLLRQPLTHRVLNTIGQPMRPARVYTPGDEITDQVCDWLEAVQSPFFMWAHYMDVHWPYHREDDLHNPREIAQAWTDLALMYERANRQRKEELSEADRKRFVGLYKSALAFLDTQIGRLLDSLEELGHASNTIVMLVSDHGEEFMEHGRWGHWESNLFDEILKVPLLIKLPGAESAQVVDEQVRLLDLMPTILDVCGCEPPATVEGSSLKPFWSPNGEPYSVSDALSEMQRPPWHRIAVRTPQFKYIWDSKKPDDAELYDLLNDAAETQNVSDLHPHLVHRYQSRVDAHLRRVSETEMITVLEEPEMDEDVLRRLRDLGYVE